jgi:predicted nucleotidyltransferase
LFTSEERERTAKKVSDLLETDTRIDALVLVGSLASNTGDHWSDIDLDAVISDGVDHGAMASDWVQEIKRQLPVLHHYATAFGETYVRGFLLDNLLELDLALTPQSEFAVWGPATIVFDRSGKSTAAVQVPVTWPPSSPGWASEAGFFGTMCSMPARR